MHKLKELNGRTVLQALVDDDYPHGTGLLFSAKGSTRLLPKQSSLPWSLPHGNSLTLHCAQKVSMRTWEVFHINALLGTCLYKLPLLPHQAQSPCTMLLIAVALFLKSTNFRLASKSYFIHVVYKKHYKQLETELRKKLALFWQYSSVTAVQIELIISSVWSQRKLSR